MCPSLQHAAVTAFTLAETPYKIIKYFRIFRITPFRENDFFTKAADQYAPQIPDRGGMAVAEMFIFIILLLKTITVPYHE